MSETKIDYAFAEITFSKEIKDCFSKIVKDIVPEKALYYSPVIERIKGDMTNTLHCTLFYGLNPNLINDSSLNNLLIEANIEVVKLGKLFFIDGYQGLYKVLCIEVIDYDKSLSILSEKIYQFAKNVKYEFKPHLTLAYVTSDYKFPEDLTEIRKEIKVSKVKISRNLDL